MKKLLILLSLVSSLSFAQQNREAWKVIGLYTGAVIMDAIGDACMDDGNKLAGHAFNAASIAFLVAQPVILRPERRNWYVYPILT